MVCGHGGHTASRAPHAKHGAQSTRAHSTSGLSVDPCFCDTLYGRVPLAFQRRSLVDRKGSEHEQGALYSGTIVEQSCGLAAPIHIVWNP
ncbi:hypothetical protein VTO73DRAFT_5118 [Trametes versicolor]